MGHKDIMLGERRVGPHKAFMEPNFEEPTILVDDQFDYVELWLKRNAPPPLKPILYWQQARNFYHASLSLPKESRPLTAYYCMLNATKALLEAKGIPFSDQHGVSGKSEGTKTSLANEICSIKGSGILISLARYFGANLSNRDVSLKDILYNIPFIHRAYTVTYRKSSND